MIVGIPGSLVGPNSFGIGINYMQFIQDSLGSDIRILTPSSPIFSDLDLLILPGGADVNPLRYGEIPGFYTDKPDLLKEYFDVHILPDYIYNRTPIFGICRGLQTICVHFGGKLHQNMWHETNKAEDGSCGVHEIKILSDLKRKVKVNSRHHQSVKRPSMDSPIIVLAQHATYSGHVEAVRIMDYPITAVQYHPEDLDEKTGFEYSLQLINSILRK